MKKLVLIFLAIPFAVSVNAQKGILGQVNKALGKDSTKLQSVTSKNLGGSSLSNEEIIKGLKEALSIGTDSSTKKLSRVDGFFTDAAIKILMPEEAKKAEKTLRSFGMSALVDNAILSMNRAAEDAASGVSTIFLDAIKQMSLSDGLSILRGGDFAATEFLKKNTTATLTEKMRPVIEASLNKVNATQYWKDVFTAYNKFSRQQINTDLTGYVTGKAMDGIFHEIGLEEQRIRKDPAAQVTDLLKKVFSN
ncbi:MAG: DUF4197 domain-containing protein [Ferruginibacter sp.]